VDVEDAGQEPNLHLGAGTQGLARIEDEDAPDVVVAPAEALELLARPLAAVPQLDATLEALLVHVGAELDEEARPRYRQLLVGERQGEDHVRPRAGAQPWAVPDERRRGAERHRFRPQDRQAVLRLHTAHHLEPARGVADEVGVEAEAAAGRPAPHDPRRVVPGFEDPRAPRPGLLEIVEEVPAPELPDHPNGLASQLGRMLDEVPDPDRARVVPGSVGSIGTLVLPERDLVGRAVRGARHGPDDPGHLHLLAAPLARAGTDEGGDLGLRHDVEPRVAIGELEAAVAGQGGRDAPHAHRAALEGAGGGDELRDGDLDRPPVERLVDLDGRESGAAQPPAHVLDGEPHVGENVHGHDVRPELHSPEKRRPARGHREPVRAHERVAQLGTEALEGP
jgi:hypothetical protein